MHVPEAELSQQLGGNGERISAAVPFGRVKYVYLRINKIMMA